MVNAGTGTPAEVASVPLSQPTVHLKIGLDFRDRADQARFYYSLDGKQWEAIGDVLKMRYTIPHFMGYRFALFHYATEQTGGVVDFDSFRIGGKSGAQNPG
jgi:beta-xylosidase